MGRSGLGPGRGLFHAMGVGFLLRRRGASLAAVLILAAALGANSLAYSVLDGFLFASFGVPDPERFFVVSPIRELPGRGEVVFADAWPNYELLRETTTSYSALAATLQASMSWDADGEMRVVRASRVTASFFAAAAVEAVAGRVFDESEEGPDPAPVAVIAHTMWMQEWDGGADAIGSSIALDGATYTIIGVMPPGFAHPVPTDLWLPFDVTPALRTAITGGRTLGLYGRLADGVSFERASAELGEVTELAREASPDNAEYRYELRSVVQVNVPGADRTVVLVQIGAALLVLLAVLNVSTVLVAWGFERRREMAVRVSLGASEGRVLGMLLLQNALVVAVGALAALALVTWTIPLLAGAEWGAALQPFMGGLRLDGATIAITAGVALVSAALAGVLPALLVPRGDVHATLGGSARASSLSRPALRWQRAMVLGQATLTMVLVTAATAVGASLWRLSAVDPGFVAGDKVVARVQMSAPAYQVHERRAAFAERLMEALAEEPALEAAGFTSTLPVSDVRWGGRFFADLADASGGVEPLLFHFRRASWNYHEVAGIAIVSGRAFQPADDRSSVPVAIVSAAVAERLWPGEDAVGKPLWRFVAGADPERLQVVGVAGNTIDAGAAAPPGEAVYVPYAQVSLDRMSIVVDPRTDATSAVAAIRSALRKADPTVAAGQVASLESLLAQENALPRLQTLLLVAFALVATGIAALGCYGVMSQLVAVREQEMAVRSALGATPKRLGASVVRQATGIALPGVILGLIVVYATVGLLQPFVYEVDARSPLLLASVTVAVLVVTLLAAVGPALRAMRAGAVRDPRG